MKILITGCGMLGYDIFKSFNEEELYALDIAEPSFNIENLNFQICDITDFDKTYRLITKINPEIVIHTAAWTDVDGAEKNISEAYRLNVLGTRNIALSCQRFDAAMVYISSDYIFDGEKKEPYIEFDKANPISVYGKSKYYGEVVVQQLLNKYYIIRSSWLFGKYGKNFVKTILNLSETKKQIEVVNDQVGCPTYTNDLSSAIQKLVINKDSMSTGLYGIYHITNSESCSWYDFAKQIIKVSKKKCEILPVNSEKIKRPAIRPKNSVLNNFIWELNGFEPLRNWKESLSEYLGEI
ncbi:MAG: dTDP-4-dehydrorhamnose reductase [Elusimicrobia bacterium RIFOXYC2_FULL_34_12]|nr:MAG: dTDP-4-dehydrorhamnose reductase [Elusimicrobia bacterium RIFOXYC2_FULL_34_12]